MAHVREQIRDRLVSRVTGLPVVGANVYAMRRYALDQDKLPAILVYTMDETSALGTMGLRTLLRRVNASVEILVKGGSDAVSDTIDDICVSVEESIAADFTLNGLAKSCVLRSTEVDIGVQGEYSVGTARLVYSIEYVTTISDVETAR